MPPSVASNTCNSALTVERDGAASGPVDRSVSDADFQRKVSDLFMRLGEAFQILSTSAAAERFKPSATDEPQSEA